jgi:uncharacterized protein (DUF2147 family)
MKRLASLIILGLSVAIAHAQYHYAPAAPPAEGILGYWSTNAGAVLQVKNCGDNICIEIMTISQKAPGVIDHNNPDASLRDRPVCHINIGTGLKLKDPNHAESGKIYDPISGKTYRAAISSDGNTLSLRGYIGIKAIGRSESWHRTPAESSTCVGTTHR